MAPNDYDDESGEEDSVDEVSVEEVVAKKRRTKKWKVRAVRELFGLSDMTACELSTELTLLSLFTSYRTPTNPSAP